ncbi:MULTISPECIES: Crp/Fnr family transcriptional regulator [Exiguobacterium]|uniref:Transcriptional regulator, Crp/Fnr family n=1 Tax=Exiguobacterium sibiricum (strain DSM 17290 / CCUG 55495 / CIP 109462 / JCM 13490 / 255-15) TaxID=262543 RepID=B1YJP6_EXIS2|nr:MULTISPECIES: Crp/Fnr family transcriptional regulator [Exiguobacterium]ACB60076.1 transcriptional regulator, Crp/Fnr family [Exiguobacterium sibiricum 255-15]MCT4791532.1 Crp/Fnr family transcriptional regulator [Exiguobacterium artemiae]MDX1260469.1 Crp/Fnr family transcriptional regulator [Exiguobacterium sp. K1]
MLACGTTEANTFVLSAETRMILEDFMTEVTFKKDSIVCWEGELNDKLFYVKQGGVKLSKLTKKGSPLMMFLYFKGDLFGEFDVGEAFPSSYSIETMEDSILGVISKSKLEELMKQDGVFALEIMRWQALMRKQSETKLRDLLLFGKQGALASTLLRLIAMHGKQVGEDYVISKRPSDSELGQLIGAPRETVNRMFSQWKKDKVISSTTTKIIVHDANYLRDLCHCEGCPVGVCRI